MGERDTLPHYLRELVRGVGNPARPFVCSAVSCGKTLQRSEDALRHTRSLHTPEAGTFFDAFLLFALVDLTLFLIPSLQSRFRARTQAQYMDSHRRKKGRSGAGPLGGCAMDENKDQTVRSRKDSGVAVSRSRRVRSIATVEDEDE
ncbi:hypothetical protein FRB96_003851 [Tulasnella sp. 330]|nr:hypothetical protein FRB96_003851 [Tulasnella sp. 330]